MEHSVWLYKNNQEIIWSLTTDDIEKIAGIVAGAIILLENTSIWIDTTADISLYRVYSGVEGQVLSSDKITKVSFDLKNAIWIKSSSSTYSLYQFNSGSFITGLITIFGHFEQDFRNYIYALPFNDEGQSFDIAGYNLSQFNYFTDVLENDDSEEEQKDDESFTVPYLTF